MSISENSGLTERVAEEQRAEVDREVTKIVTTPVTLDVQQVCDRLAKFVQVVTREEFGRTVKVKRAKKPKDVSKYVNAWLAERKKAGVPYAACRELLAALPPGVLQTIVANAFAISFARPS